MKPYNFWINLSEFRNLESAIFPEKEHITPISHFEKTKMVIKGNSNTSTKNVVRRQRM